MEFSERISGEYLSLNSCGRQFLGDREHILFRKNGRVDYHILYIEQGCCYVEDNGRFLKAEQGSLVLFRPGEPQHYRFSAEDDPVSCYIHFSGTGCEKLLARFSLGMDEVFQWESVKSFPLYLPG